MFFSTQLFSQVTGVNYQIRYDTAECRYDAYVIVNSGSANIPAFRIQANAQFSVVVRPGDVVSVVESHNPQALNGTGPAQWTVQNALTAAAFNSNPSNAPNMIDMDYYGMVPSLSPTAAYTSMTAGDTIKIFSFTVTPTEECTQNVRMWENWNENDPNDMSGDPSSNFLNGPNFNNGFTVGLPTQRYEGNSPQVLAPNPLLAAEPMCATGLEIDLSATASSCQTPLTYVWTGPNAFTSTDEDVAIDPAGEINNGTYKIVVTDALGCKDSLEVEAIAKPVAGEDLTSCAGSTVTLQGSEPTTGTWSADATNPTAETVGATTAGDADVTFSATAAGNYNFIYTVQNCSDTVLVVVTSQDAGPDPAPINCNQTGTASLNAVGVGVWSVDPSSPGTADIADVSSPTTTVDNFSVGGTYTLLWTLDGCTDEVEIVVNENCGCPIADNTLSPIDPNEFCGTSGIVAIDGAAATPAGTYLWEFSTNGGAFTAAAGANTGEDYNTADLAEGMYTFRRIYDITGGQACSDTSNTVSLTVNPLPDAPADLTATPNPICLGETVSLSVTQVAGISYTWSATAAAGLGNTTTSTNSMTPTAAGTYTITVEAILNNCTSLPSTIDVLVNPVPDDIDAADLLGNDPTACEATDGSIDITGLQANTTFTLEYTINGTAASASITSNGTGNAQLSGLAAGTYSDFALVNSDGCSSNPQTAEITLSEPDAPDAPSNITASPNPECAGEPVTITVDLIDDATYTWTISPDVPGLGISNTNTNIFTADDEGQYTVSVTQTIAGCTSAPISIGININGAPPTPDASIVIGTNPSACGGTDGFITVGGLDASTTYTVTYNDSGTPQSLMGSTNASGEIIITGLSEGSYTDFQISNFAGCISGVFAGPISLADPGSPEAPANLTAMPNPICLGETIDLSVDANPGATFNWSANSPDAGLNTSTTNANILTPTVSGTYTISVSQTVAGCTSMSSSIEVEVLDAPGNINPANVDSSNPSACGGSNGNITIAGLMPNIAFDVTYDFGGNNVSVNLTTNGSGVLIISGLSAGTYSNFVLTNAGGCGTDPFNGPISLTDPDAPAPPADIAANPNPACVGEVVTISVTNDPAATYMWTLTPAGSGSLTVNGNTAEFTVPSSSSFDVAVTQTVAGCTSAPANITIFGTTSPNPLTIDDFTVMNPSGCQQADGSFSIINLVGNSQYGINYDSLGISVMTSLISDASGTITVTGLASGTYSNFELINPAGCSSGVFAGPVSLSDPGAPDAPANLVADPNPSCLGETVALSVDNNPGAVYTWSASSPDAGIGTSTTNTNSLAATAAGTYMVSVFQTIAGCISPAAMIEVEVFDNPPTPTVGDVTSTDITGCGVSDGTITIGGYISGNSYTVNYSFNGTATSATVTVDASGNIVITGLDIGSYTDFSITNEADCASGVFAGPVELDGPPAPPAPEVSADPNPICFGNEVTLTVNNPDANATYTWTADSPNAGLVTTTASSTVMNATVAGSYTIRVSQTINGCTSPTGAVEVVINAGPAVPVANGVDPSGCAQTDGSILLSSYTAGQTYTVNYTADGNPQSFTGMADGNGVISLINLGAGTYANFSVSDDSDCESGVFAGPVVLIEPGSPDAPTGLTATPNPVCLENTVNLSVNTLPGATINWSITDQNGGLSTSTGNTNTMTPTVAGTYVVSVSQTISGCTSPPAMVSVLAIDGCLNPDFGVTYADISLTGDLSTNDNQLTGSTYGNPVAVGSNPSGCTPDVSTNGEYVFICSTPGEYEFLVEVCKPGSVGECTQEPLVITVLDIESTDNPPVINHDYIYTNTNTPVDIEVNSNDECQSAAGCSLGPVTLVTPPSFGTFNTNTFVYTPQAGYVGVDSFRYSVSQSPSTPQSSDEEWVYIDVYPSFATTYTSAMDDYGQTTANTVLTVGPANGLLLNDVDAQGNAQEVNGYSETKPEGSIVISPDGGYVFTPATDYVGPVDFAYQVCRVANNTICDMATLHLLVSPEPESGNVGSIVWLDTDGDGRYEANSEQGIPDVTVRLINEEFEIVEETVTDAGGNYFFESVIPGNYFLEFVQPEGLEVTVANVGDELNDSDVDDSFGIGTTALFEMIPGEDISNIKAGYYECVSIGDNVWYDVNENDVFDDFENGIDGLEVELWRNVGGSYELWETTTTSHKPGTPSDDGWYNFCVAPGTYFIRIEVPPYGLVQARPNVGNDEERDSDIDNFSGNGQGTSQSFTVTAGNPKLDLGAGYYPDAMAGNLVWMDENLDGIQNTFEERVEGVVVQAYEVGTNMMLGESVTDENGEYMIDFLEKKEIYLKFYPPSGLIPTTEKVGWNSNLDSDVDHTYGENTTGMYSMDPDYFEDQIDMGLAMGVLPVTWLDVNVTREGRSHLVSWEVADQHNVESYVIQRMLEGEQVFTTLENTRQGAVDTEAATYQAKDLNIETEGIYYYRVKQVDFDGQYSFSDISTIKGDGTIIATLYPNPVSNKLNIETTADEGDKILINIYDAGGKLLQSKRDVANRDGIYRTNIDVADILSGVYNISISVGSSTTNTKFVKID